MAKADLNPAKHVIKRYANRKLYDSTLRRFTTLDELARLAQAGVRIVVKDHDSGEDRTEEVLIQALGRRVRGTPGASDLLAGLLRAPANVALDLADGIKPPAAAPPATPSGKDGTKPKKPKSKKNKSKKAAAPAQDAQAREIEDLRAQVFELTRAVEVLLQERLTDHEER